MGGERGESSSYYLELQVLNNNDIYCDPTVLELESTILYCTMTRLSSYNNKEVMNTRFSVI